ncbi:MAG TPA: SpoIIIAH-like family protein [Bacillales bacterium]|nr:SpoIIIAH-like family protein [Bacillales bacterium]
MMLKKQTVWLLTMLSLIIVLSVYYMTSPVPNPGQQTAVGEDDKQEKKQGEDSSSNNSESESPSKKEDTKTDSPTATSITGEATFASAKLKKMEAREELQEHYTAVIASSEATPEEKAEAKAKLDELSQMSAKEKMLESLIVAKGFNDALVSVDGEKIRIYVQTKQLSNEQAAEILDLVVDKVNVPTHNIMVTYKAGAAE